jgi:tetratricopeptide (TPR) repeat protein
MGRRTVRHEHRLGAIFRRRSAAAAYAARWKSATGAGTIRRVLRLAGFFVVTILMLNLLRQVPWIGGLFHGLLGFWLAAIAVAALASKLADAAVSRRRLSNSVRALGAVDRPHNHGKLGSLYSAHRRFARALPHLDLAAEGEPGFAEWHYRRGLALLELGRRNEAIAALEKAEELSPEHAYGAIPLALARARLELGETAAALEALDCFERNHGPSPESAYWRGRVLRRAGRAAEARASFRDVGQLAAQAARFQQKRHRGWVWRSWWARWV